MTKKSILKKYTGKGGLATDTGSAADSLRNSKDKISTVGQLNPTAIYNSGQFFAEQQAKAEADKIKKAKGYNKTLSTKEDGSLSNSEVARVEADEIRDRLNGKVTARPTFPKTVLKRAVVKAIPQNFYNPIKKSPNGDMIKPIQNDAAGFKSNADMYKQSKG